jgi:transcription initiation factor IIE alpha subunit
MLSYDKEKLIPLCSQCSKELKEISVKSTNTNYYEFDSKIKQYKLTQRMEVEDDNLFHCSECGADLVVKDILETMACLSRLNTNSLVEKAG